MQTQKQNKENSEMKQIELMSLHLKNFKGIRDLKISCNRETNIYGDNATGKTTFKDALKWLLFGKDSSDRTDSGKGAFTLKTLDETGKVIPGIEHSVTGELYINNQSKILKRTFREKWTKKRGEADATFTGHETKFWVNDVPVTAGEYHQEVSGIIEETLFKLITDPLYFSSYMHWQDRRKILESMIEDITDSEIISSNEKLQGLIDILNDGDVDKLRKKITGQKKNLNDELKAIPVRIDECNNSFVDVRSESVLKSELESKNDELSLIEDQLTDATKEDPAIAEKKTQLNGIRGKISEIESQISKERFEKNYELKHKLQELEAEKKGMEKDGDSISQKIDRLEELREELKSDINKYRKEWDTRKDEEFILADDFICPTCGRKLPENDIAEKKEELKENFNLAKSKDLDRITKRGKDAASQLADIEKEISQLADDSKKIHNNIAEIKSGIEKTKKEIEDFENTDPEYSDEYFQLRTQAISLSEELKIPVDSKEKIDELKASKEELTAQVDEIKSELRKVESNKKLEERVSELSTRERELSQQIAKLEGQEFLCEEFIKTKVKLLDTKINSMFTFVRFKLFDEQINGGLTETCEALIDGVPFSDANNASKINAGIDIINTLSRHYNVTAPIVIDNRESINQIIPTDAQVINLIVSKDQKLKVA